VTGWPDWVNFRPTGDCLFGQWLGNNRSSPHYGQLYCSVKLICINRVKMDWATFWAIFSQTHLVTLHTVSSQFR
jgi:hypothetical protein